MIDNTHTLTFKTSELEEIREGLIRLRETYQPNDADMIVNKNADEKIKGALGL